MVDNADNEKTTYLTEYIGQSMTNYKYRYLLEKISNGINYDVRRYFLMLSILNISLNILFNIQYLCDPYMTYLSSIQSIMSNVYPHSFMTMFIDIIFNN